MTDFVAGGSGARTTPSSSLGEFREAMDRAARLVRENELVVAAHPDDLTDEMRQEIEAAPLTTLRESRLIPRGRIYLVRPGELEKWLR